MGISMDQDRLLWNMHKDYVQKHQIPEGPHQSQCPVQDNIQIQENFMRTSMHPSETRLLQVLILLSIGCIVFSKTR
jgi:hypothetical protein